MIYAKQFLILCGITLVGEALSIVIPMPVPGSVWGLLLLFMLLSSKLLKLEQVEGTANFLLAVMPLMFVPTTVGLMNSYAYIQGSILQILAVVAISSICVFFVTGHVVQAVRRKDQKHKEQS